MAKKIVLNLPMNVIYRKEEGKVFNEVKPEEEITLMDKLSNTYPRPYITFLGKTSCVENALMYLNSSNMPIEKLPVPYAKLNKEGLVKKYIQRLHHVPNYNALATFLIADSLLSDRKLIAKKVDNEKIIEFENVLFRPVTNIRTGVIVDDVFYEKGKLYARLLKSVIWEILNVWDELLD